ncbi:hypothetical protein KGV55_00780 [Candidatus Gracilibacteria bacterium]|nr:hypothetical protein [Candidatus Gracilibacteria bacterium]
MSIESVNAITGIVIFISLFIAALFVFGVFLPIGTETVTTANIQTKKEKIDKWDIINIFCHIMAILIISSLFFT